jgi:hypothetical protein
MLVLNAYLHPQDPQDPVFDLMCVPTVMHAKKVQSNGWCKPVATRPVPRRDASNQQQ